ncbi:MAG: NfeD family protein [Deltaproteobacteria bacterium]|nr:NfeD family protein [Deltaproteobacteria bacterium]MBW2378392.1 NfeD family protein [Deltaproteobacteria bacterium]MBW2626371.1 NfeD family protein [Deltaproteobacteria bacterium]MBW2685710.1 NfeD family protein [Deltaproteobacteria bacterium]
MTIAVIIVVLVLGLVLVFTEVAVIPGFGVAGALGLLALAAGAIAAWTELGPLWGGVVGGASVLTAGAMLYWLPKSRLGRKMVLEHSQAEAIAQEDRSDLLGRRGVTVTPLRPIGRVRFGSDEVDVMTEGEYVDSNQEVEVMSVEGPRVVVRIPDAT